MLGLKMFRHSLKLPILVLRKPNRHPLSLPRLYRTSSVIYQNKYDDKKECPNDRSGRGFYYTVGAIVVGTGAVVALAKHDEEFRSWLRENVPGSDEFISFITAEKTSHVDYIMRWINEILDTISQDVMSLFGKKGGGGDGKALPPCDDDKKPYIPPKPAYKPLVDVKPEPEKYTEKRVAEKIGDAVTITPIEGTLRKAAADAMKEATGKVTSAISLVDLESAAGVASQQAIKAYNAAVCVIRDHAEEVYRLVEESVENVDSKVWTKIKTMGEERERLLGVAEQKAKEATATVKKMLSDMVDPSIPGGEEVRTQAIKNTERILKAIDDAKISFDQERARVAVTDKYWTKVQEARRYFEEELMTLFPNVRLNEKSMKLAEADVDLFILYAFENILYYQKELSKIETVSKMKLKQILEQSKVDDQDALQCAIEAEMEKEKRKIGLEFQKRMLTLRAECERDMRLQMKRQAEAHQDHLMEALALKEKEIERKLQRKMDEQVLEEKNKFKTQLASVVGRLKGFDEAMTRRAGQDKKAQQSQVLWSACQSLEASLRNVASSVPVDEQLRPLQNEIDAIKKAAAPKDEFVDAVLSSIPAEALVRGVFTEAVLRDRFLRVEKVAHRVALLPEGGASIPVMLVSYLQSVFVFNPANPIPPYELANEPFEPAKFDTFDILQRARYWVDRGDLAQCLRYMNLLQGASRAVSKEWMNEARILLETQQAVNALMAHASATGLVYS